MRLREADSFSIQISIQNMKKLTITLFFFIVSAVAAMAQNWAVAVNTADMLDLGTISLEGSVAVSQHWSINAGAKVNPWTFNRHNTWNGLFSEPDPDQKQSRKQVYAIGTRWWPWNVYSGWWVGGKAQYQEYNRGGLRLPIGVGNDGGAEEGDAFGAALSGGYSLMLKEHWNLDFGLGVWGGWTKYRKYEYPENGKLIEQGHKWFFLPNEVILSIVYIF